LLWEKSGDIDFRAHGVDYWLPAHFSTYSDDSQFHLYFNGLRQQIHSVLIGSHFAWFHRAGCFKKDFYYPVLNSKSIVFSCQYVGSSRQKSNLMRELEIADLWFPPKTRFFLLAGGGIKRFPKRRQIFVIVARWQFLGIFGRGMNNKRLSISDRKKILYLNLKEVLNAYKQGIT
jgi:hypothetical protein